MVGFLVCRFDHLNFSGWDAGETQQSHTKAGVMYYFNIPDAFSVQA